MALIFKSIKILCLQNYTIMTSYKSYSYINVKFLFLLQRKSRMVLLCGQTVWVRVRERRPWKEKANFRPSVDSSNRGSGSGKRNRINLRPPHYVRKSIYSYITNHFIILQEFCNRECILIDKIIK